MSHRLTGYCYYRFIAIPIGRAYHLRGTRARIPEPNDALEALFKKARGKPKEAHVAEGVKATGKTAHAVEKWFVLRRQLNQPTVMDKFCEALWRFVFYLSATVYGLVILWDKSWFWDTLYCWVVDKMHGWMNSS